jgi:hypothetical protein
MVNFVPFHELEPGVHALTDASSLASLASRASALTTKLDPRLAREILSDLDGFQLMPSLALLERWIVVEKIVVDAIALDSLNRNTSAVDTFRYEPSTLDAVLFPDTDWSQVRQDAFDEHVKRSIASAEWASGNGRDVVPVRQATDQLSLSYTIIPHHVFAKCMTLIGRTSKALQTSRPDVRWGSFGFGLDKKYGESLAKFYERASLLARSHLGVERTLVYYETAAAAGLPLILHPDRFAESTAIETACCDAYALVSETLRTAFEEPVRGELAALGQTHRITAPALVTKLVTIAGVDNLSILDAAKQVKASKHACAFRRWLAEIQIGITDGTLAGKLEALRMLTELKQTAQQWATHLDATVGVTHKRRELRLSWVPRIGGLLDLLDKRTFRDPILNRKGYLGFVSSWFETEK